ncbi:MAG: hypothetical protein E7614_09160 [Ruminococcaceae bacterium]|nr:hypothetical protein [Oscillospiraceae bacterium]
MLVKRFLGIIFGDSKEYREEKKKYEGLPKGCWHCELLGICRRPKEQCWKCYHGCMILNAKRKRGDSDE